MNEPDRIGRRLESHRHVATGNRVDELEEVAVADHDLLHAATIDVAPLFDQRQERRVDDQLPLFV